MTVSISKMTIDYYLDSVATGDQGVQRRELTAYYTESGAPPGYWLGSGLASLGGDDGEQLTAGDAVTREQALELFEQARNPVSGDRLGRAPMQQQSAPEGAKTPVGRTAKSERKPVSGFDLTFSVPKSVSTLWAMAGTQLQGQIAAAHRQAMQETLDWAEQNVVQSRAGHGGVASVPVTGLLASAFDHWDSRAGDPQLHTHVVVSNRVQRVLDGQWMTLDSYTLHRHVVALSEKYNALLFDRLHEQVGALAESRSGPQADRLAAVLSGQELDSDADTATDTSGHRVELAGVPDSLIEEFSTRSRMIEARKDELVAQWAESHGRQPPAAVVLQLRQQATLETRTPKTDAEEPLATKMASWRDRARAGGHDPSAIVSAAVGHDRRAVTADQLTDTALATMSDWVLADTANRRTTFTRANVLASAERLMVLVRFPDAASRHQATAQLADMALAQAVELTPRRMSTPEHFHPATSVRGASVFDHQQVSGRWTTQQVMDDEAFLLSRFADTDGPGLDADTVSGQVAAVRTAGGHALSADQAEATARVLSSGQQLEAIIGPAGTGKTTTMAAVADLWQAEHGQSSVVGLAPSAVAAGVLGDEIGVDTENTAKWLYESVGDGAARRADKMATLSARLDQLWSQPASQARTRKIEALSAQLAAQHAAQAQFTLAKDQLLIIDEASMVSTAQLAELNRQAEAAGAKVLLVGDPAQLGAVDAGGFLGLLDRTEDVARLNMVWRFRNDWERKASLDLRKGKPSALDAYEEAGRIHGHPDTDASDAAYQGWLADRREGKSTILIAADNATVTDLNARAQADLVAEGSVDIETTVALRGESFAGIGDQLLARRNDRSLRDSTGAFIANGTRLQLTEVLPDGAAVATVESTGGTVTLDPDYLASSTELGYATTAHRSQGVTVDTGHVVTGAGQPRELFYVAMTRGREANHAYVDLAADPHSPDPWALMREKAPEELAKDELLKVLAAESAEKSAHEVKAAEAAWANDLGRMCHEHDYLDWAVRAERTHEWISQHAPDTNTAAALRAPDTWSRLVRADPARTLDRPIDSGEDAMSVIRSCTPADRVHPTDPIPDAPEAVATAEAEVRHNLEAELAGRVRATKADRPDWYVELEAMGLAPERHEQAVRDVLIWRAVSDRDEMDAALGDAPEPGPLSHYYERAYQHFQADTRVSAAPSETPEARATTPVAEPVMAPEPDEHRERLDGLTADALDLSGLPDRDEVPSWDTAAASMDFGPDPDGPESVTW